MAVIAVTVAREGLDLLEGLLTRQGKLKNGEKMVFEKKIHQWAVGLPIMQELGLCYEPSRRTELWA